MEDIIGPRRRRRHSNAFKAQVVAACHEPGVSVAAVALAHGLNANLLRRWIQQARTSADDAGNAVLNACKADLSSRPDMPALPTSTTAPRAGGFLPLALPTGHDIRIDIQRQDASIQIRWPVSAATDCATWLGQWLS